MRKLSLKLDELQVETFETVALGRGAGTVNAHETFESECVCGTGGGGGSAESCTACGCDTPGYTCEDRCWPETQAPQTTEAEVAARAAVIAC
jgi:hypothetical protein